MKIRLASVVERRHDIGILKAIGWPNKVIVWQIMIESLALALAGGVLGCLAAMLFVALVPLRFVVGQAALTGIAIPAYLFFVAVALCVLGGMIAGAIPALNAARKCPAEALRRI
jgi:putative ABC transport system permease protein